MDNFIYKKNKGENKLYPVTQLLNHMYGKLCVFMHSSNGQRYNYFVFDLYTESDALKFNSNKQYFH